jgi:hypothetical protein
MEHPIENVRFWWQMVTWFAPLFVIQAYGRFWKSGIMYISILSLCLWKGEALNTKNFNRETTRSCSMHSKSGEATQKCGETAQRRGSHFCFSKTSNLTTHLPYLFQSAHYFIGLEKGTIHHYLITYPRNPLGLGWP